MPKKRKRTVAKTVRKPRRRRYTTAKRAYRKASGYARSTLGGVNIQAAVKSTLPMLLGALVGKAAAKKFAEGGAETDNWTWKNYVWCLGGAFLAALGTSAVFKGNRETAQKVFQGGLLLTAYKIFTNEVAPKNTTLETWFGADDEEERLIESAAQAIDPYSGLFGTIAESPQGDFQMLGEHYVPASYYGSATVPSTPTLGQDIVPAGPRLGEYDVTKVFEEAYR